MDKKTLNSYIRVNHAGEFGAVRIYEGQRDALKHTNSLPLIEEMLLHEQEHLQAFEHEMLIRQIRPTAFLPIWSALGYSLGYICGTIGTSAAMACTRAVEEIIDDHYEEQLKIISEEEKILKEKIKKFQEEEIHHKNLSIEHGAKDAPFSPILTAGIRAATLLAIFISKKI